MNASMARRKLGLSNACRKNAFKRNPAHGVPAARTQRGIAAAPANGLSSSPTKIAQAIPSQHPLAVYERLLGQITRSAKTIQKFP